MDAALDRRMGLRGRQEVVMGVALAAVSCLSVMLAFGQAVPQGPLARGLAGRSLPVGPAADPDAAD